MPLAVQGREGGVGEYAEQEELRSLEQCFLTLFMCWCLHENIATSCPSGVNRGGFSELETPP